MCVDVDMYCGRSVCVWCVMCVCDVRVDVDGVDVLFGVVYVLCRCVRMVEMLKLMWMEILKDFKVLILM